MADPMPKSQAGSITMNYDQQGGGEPDKAHIFGLSLGSQGFAVPYT